MDINSCKLIKEPKIFVSIKGKNNFCSLDSLEKSKLFKEHNFQVNSYRDFNQTHGSRYL